MGALAPSGSAPPRGGLLAVRRGDTRDGGGLSDPRARLLGCSPAERLARHDCARSWGLVLGTGARDVDRYAFDLGACFDLHDHSDVRPGPLFGTASTDRRAARAGTVGHGRVGARGAGVLLGRLVRRLLAVRESGWLTGPRFVALVLALGFAVAGCFFWTGYSAGWLLGALLGLVFGG